MEPREGGTDQEDRGVGNQRFDFGGAEQSRNILPRAERFGEEGSFFRKQRLAGFKGSFFSGPPIFFANLHRRKPVFLSFFCTKRGEILKGS